ncbi:hypothetical protein [Mycobacterium sp. pR1184]|uniref:hypothetical protein n=1 Tax=Mycobacterium sp. pR1184 TaxID=3238981 RepID=UPI00351BBD8C
MGSGFVEKRLQGCDEARWLTGREPVQSLLEAWANPCGNLINYALAMFGESHNIASRIAQIRSSVDVAVSR